MKKSCNILIDCLKNGNMADGKPIWRVNDVSWVALFNGVTHPLYGTNRVVDIAIY